MVFKDHCCIRCARFFMLHLLSVLVSSSLCFYLFLILLHIKRLYYYLSILECEYKILLEVFSLFTLGSSYFFIIFLRICSKFNEDYYLYSMLPFCFLLPGIKGRKPKQILSRWLRQIRWMFHLNGLLLFCTKFYLDKNLYYIIFHVKRCIFCNYKLKFEKYN